MPTGVNYVIGPDEDLQWNDDESAAAGTWYTCGLVMGGNMVEESDVLPVEAVGDYKPFQLREGLFRCYGRGSIIVQDYSFIQHAIRNSGTGLLNSVAMRAGNQREYMTHKYCKINTISFECTAGGPLMANFEWRGISITPSGAAITKDAPDTYKAQMWYRGAITHTPASTSRGAGASLDITRMTINLNNNVDWKPTISTGNDPVRGAKYVIEGGQQVTAGLSLMLPENIDLSGTNLTEITSIVFLFTNGSETVRITCSTLHRQNQDRPLTARELAEHGAQYTAKDIAIAAA